MGVVGNKDAVLLGLQNILREPNADELMMNGQIFEHQARLHSFAIVSQLQGELVKEPRIG